MPEQLHNKLIFHRNRYLSFRE